MIPICMWTSSPHAFWAAAVTAGCECPARKKSLRTRNRHTRQKGVRRVSAMLELAKKRERRRVCRGIPQQVAELSLAICFSPRVGPNSLTYVRDSYAGCKVRKGLSALGLDLNAATGLRDELRKERLNALHESGRLAVGGGSGGGEHCSGLSRSSETEFGEKKILFNPNRSGGGVASVLCVLAACSWSCCWSRQSLVPLGVSVVGVLVKRESFRTSTSRTKKSDSKYDPERVLKSEICLSVCDCHRRRCEFEARLTGCRVFLET
jgi:hypothetical protein